MTANRGIYVAPFDELVDPLVLAKLATRAEVRGWNGFFLWDHVAYRAPVRALADAWVALSAVASATKQLRLGPMVTPLSRRRVHKLARETVTLDHLSEGRLTLGVGLGVPHNNELEPFGEVLARPRARAASRPRSRQIERILGWRIRAAPGAAPSNPGVGRGGLA